MFSSINNILPRNLNISILRVNQVHGYDLRSSKLRQLSVIRFFLLFILLLLESLLLMR